MASLKVGTVGAVVAPLTVVPTVLDVSALVVGTVGPVVAPLTVLP